jgi:tetratricopeptide (TPR) repeat protein
MHKIRYLFACLILLIPVLLFSQSHTVIDSLFKELESVKSDTTKVNILNALSENYEKVDYTKCIFYAKQARELSEDINYLPGLIDAYGFLSISYINLREYLKAKQNLDKALLSAQKSDNPIDLASVYNKMLLFYSSLEDYAEAAKYAFLALEKYESIEYKFGMTTVYINLGYIFQQQDNFKKSEEYCMKALGIATKNQYKKKLAIIYNNLGVIYENKQDLEKALEYYFLAAEFYSITNNKSGLSIACNNIGMIKSYQKKPKEALKYYSKALKISNELNDKNKSAIFYNKLAQHYYKHQNYDSADYFVNKALVLAEELKIPSQISEAAYLLHQLNYDKQNYKAASDYHILHKKMSDSIRNQENISIISNLEIRYNIEKMDKEIALIKQQKMFTIWLSLLTVSILSLFALLIIVVINRKRIKNERDKKESELNLEKARKEIELQNTELKSFTERIKEKNKLINEFQEELSSLEMNRNADALQNNLIQLRNMNIFANEDWIKFKELFKSVYQDFYHRLLSQFPDLTESEKRQVMLMKLGFSLNQSADMLGISYDSVKKARQRLAKKFRLKDATQLVEFIEKL